MKVFLLIGAAAATAVLETAADKIDEFHDGDSLEDMWKEAQAAQTSTRDRLRREMDASHLHPAFLNAAFLNAPSSFLEESPTDNDKKSLSDELKQLHSVTDHLSSLSSDMKNQAAKFQAAGTPSSLLQEEPTDLAPTFLKDPEEREGFKDMAAVKTKVADLLAKLKADESHLAPSSFLQGDDGVDASEKNLKKVEDDFAAYAKKLQKEGAGSASSLLQTTEMPHEDKLMSIAKKLRALDAKFKHGIARMRPVHLPSSLLEEIAASKTGTHITSKAKLDDLDEDLARLMRDDPNNKPSSLIEIDSKASAEAFLNQEAHEDREFRAHERVKEHAFERQQARMEKAREHVDAKTKRAYEDLSSGKTAKADESATAKLNANAESFDQEAAVWKAKLDHLRVH